MRDPNARGVGFGRESGPSLDSGGGVGSGVVALFGVGGDALGCVLCFRALWWLRTGLRAEKEVEGTTQGE
jgi:hypothetical protein